MKHVKLRLIYAPGDGEAVDARIVSTDPLAAMYVVEGSLWISLIQPHDDYYVWVDDAPPIILAHSTNPDIIVPIRAKLLGMTGLDFLLRIVIPNRDDVEYGLEALV